MSLIQQISYETVFKHEDVSYLIIFPQSVNGIRFGQPKYIDVFIFQQLETTDVPVSVLKVVYSELLQEIKRVS